MLVLLAAFIAVVMIGRLLSHAGERAAPPTPPTPARPRDRQAVRADVQLLFTELHHSTVTVDGVVVDGDTALERGTPLTLSVEAPASPPLQTVVTTTLDRWAIESRVVDLELRPLPPRITARLSDGRSTVNLEVETAQLG